MNGMNSIFEELIDISDLCQILKLKKSYIYLLTHERKIPHYKVQGHLRFRLSEIDEWIKKQSVKIQKEYNLVDY